MSKQKPPCQKTKSKVIWRNSKQYHEWREQCLTLNLLKHEPTLFGDTLKQYKCEVCHEICEHANVHHIENAQHNIDLRYSIDNGIVLCRACHTNFHTNFKKSYRQKTTRDDMDNFIQLSKYFMSKGNTNET